DAEPVLRRRAGAAALHDQEQVLVLRPVRREHRGEHRRRDEAEHEERADDRARVPDQPAPSLAPEAARRLELDLACLELDNGHLYEYRIRGLMIAYERSTIRFTSTNTSARNRIPP